jgi:hypothetical protein
MAKAGFSYFPTMEGEDMVECVHCGLALDGWEEDDDPLREHSKRAPKCLFFLNNKTVKAAATKSKASTSASANTTTVKKSADETDIEDEFTVRTLCVL